MQTPFPEFFEDLNDALREAVRQLGGNKKVGPLLWPELPPGQADGRLRDCLNAERREKLSPEQVLLILLKAREAGFHGAMAYVAGQAGYEAPRPVTVDEQEAELQQAFVSAVEKLSAIQAQMGRVQQMRRVG